MNFESRSISSSAVLVDLSISVPTGRKIDKEKSDKVNEDNYTANKRIAKVTKDIYAGSETLHTIIKKASMIRNRNMQLTLPWNDSGTRLLPNAKLIEHQTEIGEARDEFLELVTQFEIKLPDLCIEAKAKLGNLWREFDYPEHDEEVMRKFKFKCVYAPVAESGDFRIDIGNEARKELDEQYETASKERLETSMKDVWGRFHKVLQTISKNMVEAKDGAQKRYHESMLTNAEKLVDLMKAFNLTGDQEMENARLELHRVLQTADIDDIKQFSDAREILKEKVDDIMDKFSF
jgi:hypothetical protein|tara:strand:+ start:4492 stop:5364 length:873 start_codon:yes stop_codon:yes gene_type:complete